MTLKRRSDCRRTQLPVDEAIRRIATAFDRVSFERVDADEPRYPRPASLVKQYVLGPEKGKGGGVIVRITDVSQVLELSLVEHDGVFVVHDSPTERERWRPVVTRLADLLGYEVNTSAVVLRTTISPAHFDIAAELTVRAKVIGKFYEHNLGEVENCTSTSGSIILDLFVEDTDFVRKHVSQFVREISPGATVKYEVAP